MGARFHRAHRGQTAQSGLPSIEREIPADRKRSKVLVPRSAEQKMQWRYMAHAVERRGRAYTPFQVHPTTFRHPDLQLTSCPWLDRPASSY
jgi:hypothetical protein